MDKKSVLRNFKVEMTEKYGKQAEGTVNKELFRLIKSPVINEGHLKTVEDQIIKNLANKPLFSTKRNSVSLIDKKKKKVKKIKKSDQPESLMLKTKILNNTHKNADLKLPSVGSGIQVRNGKYITSSSEDKNIKFLTNERVLSVTYPKYS